MTMAMLKAVVTSQPEPYIICWLLTFCLARSLPRQGGCLLLFEYEKAGSQDPCHHSDYCSIRRLLLRSESRAADTRVAAAERGRTSAGGVSQKPASGEQSRPGLARGRSAISYFQLVLIVVIDQLLASGRTRTRNQCSSL